MALPETENRGRKRRVVIADDESIIRLDLGEMLVSLGYEVVGEGSDGAIAVELAQKLRPDLVIMDIKMPGMDGIAAARELTPRRSRRCCC